MEEEEIHLARWKLKPDSDYHGWVNLCGATSGPSVCAALPTCMGCVFMLFMEKTDAG